jgi:hypothetical protein
MQVSFLAVNEVFPVLAHVYPKRSGFPTKLISFPVVTGFEKFAARYEILTAVLLQMHVFQNLM